MKRRKQDRALPQLVVIRRLPTSVVRDQQNSKMRHAIMVCPVCQMLIPGLTLYRLHSIHTEPTITDDSTIDRFQDSKETITQTIAICPRSGSRQRVFGRRLSRRGEPRQARQDCFWPRECKTRIHNSSSYSSDTESDQSGISRGRGRCGSGATRFSNA